MIVVPAHFSSCEHGVLTAVKVISDALAAGDLDTVYHEMDTIDFEDVLSPERVIFWL